MKAGMTRTLALMLLAFGALASEPDFENANDAERYRALTNELRCLVCQNQTIADSNADLAVDLREQVAEMIRAGQSNEEIITYLTDRYGDFVLYRPPVKQSTWLLWAGPFILLAIALFSVGMILRKRGKMPEEPVADATAAANADDAKRSNSEDGKNS